MSSTIKVAKQSLRKAIAAKLSLLSPKDVLAQSSTVSHLVQELAAFKSSQLVALYMSMPGIEIDTLDLIRRCFEQHKTVYLPSCSDEAGKPMKTMRFLKVGSFEEVLALQPRGKYKLREPTEGVDAMLLGSIDLVIVPGVAFTKEGYRLGHGAGYYDRFLSEFQLQFDKKPFLVGVGLADQMVDSLPIEPHDWTLDEVIVGQ